jgi:hypothetical protein
MNGRQQMTQANAHVDTTTKEEERRTERLINSRGNGRERIQRLMYAQRKLMTLMLKPLHTDMCSWAQHVPCMEETLCM